MIEGEGGNTRGEAVDFVMEHQRAHSVPPARVPREAVITRTSPEGSPELKRLQGETPMESPDVPRETPGETVGMTPSGPMRSFSQDASTENALSVEENESGCCRGCLSFCTCGKCKGHRPLFLKHLLRDNLAKLQFTLGCVVAVVFVVLAIEKFVKAVQNEAAHSKPEKIEVVKRYFGPDRTATNRYVLPYMYIMFMLHCTHHDSHVCQHDLNIAQDQYHKAMDEIQHPHNDDDGGEHVERLLDMHCCYYCEHGPSHWFGLTGLKFHYARSTDSDHTDDAGVYVRIQVGDNADYPIEPTNCDIIIKYTHINLPSTISVEVGFDMSRYDPHDYDFYAHFHKAASLPAVGSRYEFVPEPSNPEHAGIIPVKFVQQVHYFMEESVHDDISRIIARVSTTIGETVAGANVTNDLLHSHSVHVLVANEVEHYKSYVTYGFLDWLAGVGGLATIFVSCCLFCTFRMATLWKGRGQLGLLPGISLAHRNAEEIEFLKGELIKIAPNLDIELQRQSSLTALRIKNQKEKGYSKGFSLFD